MNPKDLFLREVTAQEHLDAQRDDYTRYVSMLLMLVSQGVELSHATRTRVLAACWARRDFEVAGFLLDHDAWSLPEVLKALKLLDAPRQIRALQKRLERLEKQGSAKPDTLGQIRSSIQDLERESLEGSVSGALSRRVRRWIRQIPKDKLAFYALSMPPEPWRKLVDLVHARPDDFQLDWFLPVVFGQDPPPGSMAEACLQASTEQLGGLIERWQPPYSFLRRRFTMPLDPPLRGKVAAYEDLDLLLWYYEELASPEVDQIIEQRLQDGEIPGFGYAMLVERLLQFEKLGAPFYKTLIPVAEQRLRDIKLPLEAPVVVLGDASASMDVAIRVATIIGSLLAALTGAEIRFFDTQILTPNVPDQPTEDLSRSMWQRLKSAFSGNKKDPTNEPFIPQGLEDVMWLVKHVKTRGATAPAIGVLPSLQKKEVVRHWIVVTDEQENNKADGMFFDEIMQTYREQVYPSRVAFVSFLYDPQKPGEMTPRLEERGIPTLCFPMHGQRPDLTKIDALLGLLSSESAFFQEQASLLANDLQKHGMTDVLSRLPEHTQRDGDAILRAQLDMLRDLAFARSDDRQGFLGILGKIRHFARLTEHTTLAEDVTPWLSRINETGDHASAALYDELLEQVEQWELQLPHSM